MDSIESIYNADAEKYYLAFTSNAEKNHYVFSEGNMLSDLSRKKVYSVLVVATEDEEVFSLVKKALFAFDIKIERYLLIIWDVQSIKNYMKKRWLIF